MLEKIEIKDWVKANVEFINNELPLASLESKGLMYPQSCSPFYKILLKKGHIWKIYQGGDYSRTVGLLNISVNSVNILIHMDVFLYYRKEKPEIKILNSFGGLSQMTLKLYIKNENDTHSLYIENYGVGDISVNFVTLEGIFTTEKVDIDTSTLTLVQDFAVIE